jgi:hypothetical protein
LIIPRGDLVYRHLTIYGVLEYWKKPLFSKPTLQNSSTLLFRVIYTESFISDLALRGVVYEPEALRTRFYKSNKIADDSRV